MKQILYILPFVLLFYGFKQHHKTTIFMIGDSTMANKRADVFPETGWGQVLSAFVDTTKIRIENHARNGRSTKSFIDEGLWKVVESGIKPGDYVFIQFGHNDEKINKPHVYAKAETTYKHNLEFYIKRTRVMGGIPVLFTSIVRRDFNIDGLLNDTHKNYPEMVIQVGKEQGVPVIDLEISTKILVEKLGVEASKELYMNINKEAYSNYPNGKKDNTHLTRKGAIKVAEIAVTSITNQLPELADYF